MNKSNIVSRGFLPLPLILWRPSIMPTPLLFFSLSPLPFPSSPLSPTTSCTALFVVLFLWLSGDCDILDAPLNDIMDLHLSNIVTHKQHTQRHTAHSGANRVIHPYKYILTPPVMCSQQLSGLHWIIQWYPKIYFPQLLFFSKITHLFIRSRISVDLMQQN